MQKTNEIVGIEIIGDKQTFYGPDQYWYKRRLDALSGCGPTTAAITMAYLAQSIAGCQALYPYKYPMNKYEFVQYMESVRLVIKPRFGGLTDVHLFGRRCEEYAATKNVSIKYQVMDRNINWQKAFEQCAQLLDNNIMPALLILRNPHKTLKDFVWHWMSITGYIRDTSQIIIATYGKKHMLDFNKVWNQKKPYSTDIVHFHL